ncbi:MAG: amino acid permease [Anaerolineae bacterium]|nr:amino acid permease [Anaerolineae bacterium]
MTENTPEPESSTNEGIITLRGAVFIGIGSMVGAGIFALFGEAGAIAGAAVWVSFLVGGIIALLQGYSFSKLGARYPSAGGLIDWIVRGYGSGLFTGGIVMLGYFSVIIVTAMVAVSFGNYATSLLLGADAPQYWVNIFATAIVILLTAVNSIGAETASKAQTAVVTIVLIVLSSFAIAMLLQLDTTLLAPASYPPMSYILASVALTFFAYLGFGVIAFTGGDLQNPRKNLPRAMYISLSFTMLLYVALAIGVFGTLTVEEVIANADTALAVAALPIFGQFGYTMISIAAVFATTGAINSQLYAAIGATFTMAKDGHLPPVFGKKRRRGQGGTQGLVISAILIIIMANLFDVTAIASIGSAVALVIFALITIAHLRMTKETQASRAILWLALLTTSLAILLFAWYTLITSPQTFAILAATIILAWVVEAVWRTISKRELST